MKENTSHRKVSRIPLQKILFMPPCFWLFHVNKMLSYGKSAYGYTLDIGHERDDAQWHRLTARNFNCLGLKRHGTTFHVTNVLSSIPSSGLSRLWWQLPKKQRTREFFCMQHENSYLNNSVYSIICTSPVVVSIDRMYAEFPKKIHGGVLIQVLRAFRRCREVSTWKTTDDMSCHRRKSTSSLWFMWRTCPLDMWSVNLASYTQD